MTGKEFKQDYNVDVTALKWQNGHNSLYCFAVVGDHVVYHDEAWGYYVTRNGSRINTVFDLSKFL